MKAIVVAAVLLVGATAAWAAEVKVLASAGVREVLQAGMEPG